MPTVADPNLSVHCFCGKRYALSPQLAGRKIRCGRCTSVLRVGPPRETSQRPAARPAPEPRSAARGAHDPYAPPVERLQRTRPAADAAFERDLVAEGHVMAIGLWTRVWGLLLGLYALALLLVTLTASPLALLVFVPVAGLAAFHVGLGTHLMQLRPWSRIGFAVFAGLSGLGALWGALTSPTPQALGGLLGLAWSGAQLWALFGEAGSRVFADGYRERRDDRRVPYWRSVFFVVPAVCLALGLLAAGTIALVLFMN